MAIVGAVLERPVKLASLLDVGLKSKPDGPALISLERTWSWRELDQASTRLAGQYLALGLLQGDRVASLLPNRGALLVHYLACFKAELVANLRTYNSKRRGIYWQRLRRSQADLVADLTTWERSEHVPTTS